MKNSASLTQASFERHRLAIQKAEALIPALTIVGQKMDEVLRAGGKLLMMGNGGSASDAQHFAAEIVVRYVKNRAAYPAIALTTDTSLLTATGNDFSFDEIFSRQIEALGRPGDLVFGFSTSGNSKNVVEGIQEAKRRGCTTVGFLGKDGGVLKDLVDHALVVADQETARVQEVHMLMYHILCEIFEADL